MAAHANDIRDIRTCTMRPCAVVVPMTGVGPALPRVLLERRIRGQWSEGHAAASRDLVPSCGGAFDRAA
jgi:hypothetical protein